MSRVGKEPIVIPAGVTVTVSDKEVKVKGPKGELSERLPANITVAQADGALTVAIKNEGDKMQRSLWGTIRAILSNLITGVTEGFSKQLEFSGVGYKAQVNGSTLVLNVGFSHPVEYQLADGVTATVEKNLITISGIDKQLVGQVAAEIRKIRKPEPYKGKGIKYVDETIRRKAGKAAAGKSE
ncbi:MAG: 50S ribosomal protein L6 [Candidatus Buchananbacteria bacterium CG10_big_fil_rev_8_21_14_0_10_42_9]|uniref:Large ribosomal subunit protein uL6 n=1 Tax=Candidatus Buchananbacteria bacterium CG10_big_fil_rev_8_21_14_0_10_42_9 TaxID=1974526 RepID=A0A2H0W290_9BACT|nr:MAG: 50S ribosomal protein L6 [Candidatus Buchananbacteria bacterium CG10_big_fil_rev_8_21_14_0_10_42_9]